MWVPKRESPLGWDFIVYLMWDPKGESPLGWDLLIYFMLGLNRGVRFGMGPSKSFTVIG